jgi:indole-3-glycerol phosphate synthase
MPDILDKILFTKKNEIEESKILLTLDDLKSIISKTSQPRNFIEAIQKKHQKKHSAVIAEIKKASPSKGVIRSNFDPIAIAKSYEIAGATCLSILTDKDYFMGDPKFLMQVKSETNLPILRKDFIIDPYQIYESRALGADCILLIVAALEYEKMKELEEIAHSLNMAVLVEAHNQEELDLALKLDTPLIGINNRNLKTFEVSLETSVRLVQHIHNDKNRIPITESGIFSFKDVELMNHNNIFTFLVGEAFMRDDDPGKSLEKLFN